MNIGSKGRSRRSIFRVIETQVTINPAQGHTQREFLCQHQGSTDVKRHLIGFHRHGVIFERGHHFTQREITQWTTDWRIVTDAIIACHISQVNVIHQLSQPRGVIQCNTRTADTERILSKIPVLWVYIRICGRTDITHTCRTGIGGDGLRNDSMFNGVELALGILCTDNQSQEQTCCQ